MAQLAAGATQLRMTQSGHPAGCARSSRPPTSSRQCDDAISSKESRLDGMATRGTCAAARAKTARCSVAYREHVLFSRLTFDPKWAREPTVHRRKILAAVLTLMLLPPRSCL